MVNGNAKVTVTFRKSNSSTSQTQSSSMGTTGAARKNKGQLVGSVAVAFVKNGNRADISVADNTYTDSEGIVRACVEAGGAINLKAEASTQSESIADASPIDRDPKGSSTIHVNDGSATIQDQVTAQKIKEYKAGDTLAFTVVYGQMTNGSTSDEKYVLNVGNERISFVLNPRDGYYINKVWYTYVTQTATATTPEQVSPEVILYQYADGPARDGSKTYTLTSEKDPTGQNPIYVGDGWLKGKIYVYADFLPILYTIQKPVSDGKSEYSYQISGTTGTATDGNVQARSGSTVVVHSIRKGTLNNGKYDYNLAQTSDDIKLIVTYKDKSGNDQNVDVTLNSTGGFAFIMPAGDVQLKFAAKGVKLTVFDANSGTTAATPETSDLSIGQFQETTDTAGNTVAVAKMEGTVDSKDKVVLNLSQKAYDNGKRITITIEAYGIENNGTQALEKDLVLTTPIQVTNDGNGLYSFVMPDFNGNYELERKDGSGTLTLVGLRIKYAFGEDKDYKIAAQATTRPKIGGNGTTPTTPTTPGAGSTQTKLNVAETTGGKISVAPAADMGDIIYVTVTPYTGYRLVSNSGRFTSL